MLTSIEQIKRDVAAYPELAQARILITGLTASRGIDLARAFAEQGCRLILQIPEPCPQTDAVLPFLAQAAGNVHVYHNDIIDRDCAVQFCQAAVGLHNGFDVVINLIAFDRTDLLTSLTVHDVEDVVSERLQAATQISHVAANRMGFTWTSGSILNVLYFPTANGARDSALAAIARSTLATMTRLEAAHWAAQSIRINAVAPEGALNRLSSSAGDTSVVVSSEPDVAALALYLASHQGDELTGHIFDAVGAGLAT